MRRILRSRRLDGLLVTTMANVRYLSGFTGSSGFVLVAPDRVFFCTDFRYIEQSGQEVPGFEIRMEKGKRIPFIRQLALELGIKRLGFEASVSYEFYEGLSSLPVELAPQRGIVERLRTIKDPGEIDSIREAIRRAEEAFLAVKPGIRPGVTERKVALRLEAELKKRGCKHAAFAIIVASGPNSSMPHAQPTGRKIGRGDFVIIDWGGEAHGYYSDMTRTLLMAGGDLGRQRKIYDLVNRARSAAVSAVRDGVKASEVDAAARQIIADAGYAGSFGHGTGHGIGLEVHEHPRISWTAKDRVGAGMVFSVEPGIYVPGLGGVRIEDLVLAGREQGSILTNLSRDLEIVGSA